MKRECGTCTLCCKLLPVRELAKKAGERCKHQRLTGCRVYHKPGMPPACALWNCRWLVDPKVAEAGVSRPDRAGFVIDTMPDFVTLRDNETGEVIPIQVVQIWVDPKRPDAHRDPALRAYLARLGNENIVALIRFNERDAFTVIPPAMTGAGFRELHGESMGRQHSMTEIVDALSTTEALSTTT